MRPTRPLQRGLDLAPYIAEETIAELKGYHRRIAEVTFAGEPPFGLDHLPGIAVVRRAGNRLVLSIEGSVTPLLRFLAGRDDIVDLLLPPPRLEDIFLGYYDATRDRHDAFRAPDIAAAEPVETVHR